MISYSCRKAFDILYCNLSFIWFNFNLFLYFFLVLQWVIQKYEPFIIMRSLVIIFYKVILKACIGIDRKKFLEQNLVLKIEISWNDRWKLKNSGAHLINSLIMINGSILCLKVSIWAIILMMTINLLITKAYYL